MIKTGGSILSFGESVFIGIYGFVCLGNCEKFIMVVEVRRKLCWGYIIKDFEFI